jgi:hypothetical protein
MLQIQVHYHDIKTTMRQGFPLCFLRELLIKLLVTSQIHIYIFCFKGKDDLRQDAVMQQVFEMVNTLLQKNVETRKRNLKIRTYKVNDVIFISYVSCLF